MDSSRRLGYGGSAEIVPSGGFAVQLLITSGSFDAAVSPSYNNMVDIDPVQVTRSKVLHATGTAEFSASLSFDVTKAAMGVLTKTTLLKRRYPFDLGINDGTDSFVLKDCYLTQLSLSGAPGGLISAQLSAMAKEKRISQAILNAYVLDANRVGATTPNQKPLGYWWSGGADIRDWTLTMTQSVTPMYLNEPLVLTYAPPKYLKVGLIEYTLEVNLYADPAGPNAVINIVTETFTLTGQTTANGYTFNGVNDLGMYSHSFMTSALNSSDSVIIS